MELPCRARGQLLQASFGKWRGTALPLSPPKEGGIFHVPVTGYVRHVIPHCQAWIIFSANVLPAAIALPTKERVGSPLSPGLRGLCAYSPDRTILSEPRGTTIGKRRIWRKDGGADGGSQTALLLMHRKNTASKTDVYFKGFQRQWEFIKEHQSIANSGRVRSGCPRAHRQIMSRQRYGRLPITTVGTSECYRAAAQDGAIYPKMMPLPSRSPRKEPTVNMSRETAAE